jgi:hypothetical protein
MEKYETKIESINIKKSDLEGLNQILRLQNSQFQNQVEELNLLKDEDAENYELRLSESESKSRNHELEKDDMMSKFSEEISLVNSQLFDKSTTIKKL